ncbi:peroxidase [Striga asiatica]|uniref:peroxidase n=1 Tax=Striga asiatica TaxID=4170 RepID=A0A5A7P814_STRAF|nr:peroxidase [Striga asiatica]
MLKDKWVEMGDAADWKRGLQKIVDRDYHLALVERAMRAWNDFQTANPRKKDLGRLIKLAQGNEDSEEEEPEIGVGQLSMAISTHISAQGNVGFGCVLRKQEQIIKTWAKTDTTEGDAEITHLRGIKWGLTLAKEGGWIRCVCMVKCKDLLQKLISSTGFSPHAMAQCQDICNINSSDVFISFVFGDRLCTLSAKLACEAVRGKSELELNYYNQSCPKAEQIIKEQVEQLYKKHGNTAASWLRNLFHDCALISCDASLLLDNANDIISEKSEPRSFGMRNFKYINTIKEALEKECPMTVSCADIIALSARDGVALLGGPSIDVKTGRRDSTESYASEVDNYIPNHNDSMSLVLSTFEKIGVDTEGLVALLGAHSVGRTHCQNIVQRLYPTVDSTLDSSYAKYLKRRCPTSTPNPKAVEYVRNDLGTPMILDNVYYKNILAHKGVLLVDQELVSDPRTSPFVNKMAQNNEYFLQQFSRAFLILSENNPLTKDEGEIRRDCRFVNSN